MEIVQHTPKLLEAKISETESIRLSIGETTGRIHIIRYNPQEETNQDYWKVLKAGINYHTFIGKFKDLKLAFENFLNEGKHLKKEK